MVSVVVPGEQFVLKNSGKIRGSLDAAVAQIVNA